MGARVARAEVPTPPPQHYQLSVSDFGPIDEAHVRLRPLTVFVGRSNTGKSYLATLVYVLQQCFAAGRSGYRALQNWPITPSARAAVEPGAKVWQALDQWLDQISAVPDLLPLPSEVDAFIRDFLKRTQDYDVTLELLRCYGIQNLPELIRHPESQSARIRVHLPGWRSDRDFLYEFEPKLDGTLTTTGPVTAKDLPLSDIMRSEHVDRLLRLVRRTVIERDSVEQRDRSDLGDLLALLIDLAHNAWLCPFSGTAHYLPADRTGVMHSHEVITGALMQSAASAGLRPDVEVPLLSGILVDFLRTLIGMGEQNRSRNRDAATAVARVIEDSILGGEVRMDQNASNYPRLAYQPRGWDLDLPLRRASSMVSELAPIVLFLRHVVREGDLLIIDEPESHLHPGIQVEVIRRLADVVRAGVQVIITTHSEWVLEELSNIVLASRLSEDQRQEINGGESSLSPEDVGVWLFKNGASASGSIVTEIKLGESKLYSSSFDEVSVGTYNEWARIADLLEGS